MSRTSRSVRHSKRANEHRKHQDNENACGRVEFRVVASRAQSQCAACRLPDVLKQIHRTLLRRVNSLISQNITPLPAPAEIAKAGLTRLGPLKIAEASSLSAAAPKFGGS